MKQLTMYSILKKHRLFLKSYQCQISRQLADCAFASQRAMCETKRRILKKLAARIQSEQHTAFFS